MVRTVGLKNYSDVHYTESRIAKHIIDYFKPTGEILEPFRGGGHFYDQLPGGSDWCELEEGRCFFQYSNQVDWVITNPPFSNLTDVMKHCFSISENTVFLLPPSKIYSSVPRMKLVKEVAGVKEQVIFGSGRSIGFDLGFPFAAMHFLRGHKGPTINTWHDD